MKTFEEKFTAWVDGRLNGTELAAFEREIESHPDALAEKEDTLRLGSFLRANLSAPPLRNADFFNHQLLQQIQASQQAAPRPAPRPAFRRAFWTLPRMAYSGVSLLLISTLLYFAAVPNTRREVRHNQQYVANVLKAHSDDPKITATSFHSKAENVNVLWLDGLDYLPPDHKLK
jgi:anti-sigma factor RsiW